jgi:glutathione S-transferase
MKIYYSTGAASLAARIIANELEIMSQIEFIKADYKTKKLENNEDYRKINPHGMVPALAFNNNEKVLTEVSAILQYLTEVVKPNSDLLPPVGSIERYRVLEALSFVATELHQKLDSVSWVKIADDVKKILMERPFERVQFLENHMKGRFFIANNKFTIADAYLFVIYSWFEELGLKMSDYPNIQASFNHLKERPSIKKSLAQEGINL